MKILPTLDGGLKLEIATEFDWQVLMAIAVDADGDLASRLSTLMDEESMWEDIVEPELQGYFSSQLEHVLKAVRKARTTADQQEEAELHIPHEDGETWYGALNQARLALEEQYQFSSMRKLDDTNKPKIGAYIRGRFYGHLQEYLIEHVMNK